MFRALAAFGLILGFSSIFGPAASAASTLVTEGTCSRLVISRAGHIETYSAKFNLNARTLNIAESQAAVGTDFPIVEIKSDSEQTQIIALKDERATTGLLKKYVLTLTGDGANLIDATVSTGGAKDTATVYRHDLTCLP